MMKNRFIFTLIIGLLVQVGCSNSNDIPNEFYGNFFDITGTKYWTCSIYEHFIVYDNDLWNYKIKSTSENEIKLLISSESGEKKILKILKADAHYKISDGSQDFTCSKNSEGIQVKSGGQLPVMEAGVAVIKGVVFDDTTKNTQVQITVKKYFSARESEVQTAEVDEYGRFSISVPILNSQSVMLHFGDHGWRRLFVTPGDSLTILINGQSGRPVHFMGTNSDVCYHTEYVLDKLYHFGEASSKGLNLEPQDFRIYMDSLTSVKQDYLDRYSAEYQCPDLFDKWSNIFIECTRTFYLVNNQSKYYRLGAGTGQRNYVNDPYTTFIESIDINDSLLFLEAISGDMLGRISNYYRNVLREIYNSQSLTHRDVYEFLLDYSDQISVNDMTFIESLADSLKLYKTFSRNITNRITLIADPFKDEYEFRLMRGQVDRRIDFFLTQEYSLMRDLMLMIVYDDMKQARMLDVLDYVYNRIDTLIQYPVYKEDLTNDYFAFQAKVESFQNTEFVTNQTSESGKKLLLDIINSSKDTLVVLDFWYAACGPCRTGFMKMKSIKKQLYDVPIKFVYLCYSSSEKDWTNVVKEFDVKGEHHLLTGEQFAYFSNLFNISSAPRYVLIGRNGKIVNDNFAQPNSYQQYMQALRKYLGS